MFAGPFRRTPPRFSKMDPFKPKGVAGKKPLELTAVQKAGVRARLRRVDSVIDAVRASGVRCEQLHELKDYPRESEMTDDEKYKVFSKKHDGYWKPVHWVAKWTKTHLPRRFPPGLHPVAENEIVDTWK